MQICHATVGWLTLTRRSPEEQPTEYGDLALDCVACAVGLGVLPDEDVSAPQLLETHRINSCYQLNFVIPTQRGQRRSADHVCVSASACTHHSSQPDCGAVLPFILG